MAQRAEVSMPGGEPLYEGFDYASFWQEHGRLHLDELERSVVADLLPKSGRRILDAGCGFGRLTDVYVERFDEVVLVDAAWSLLEQARDRWAGSATLVAGDLHALPFAAGTFDATLIVRVLHHFADPAPVLSGLRRVSAPGGRLVFSASNNRNAKRVARYVLGRGGPSPFAEGPVPYGTRSFGWHPRDIERLVEEAGFELRGFRGVGVLDKVAAHAGPLGALVPLGKVLAGPLGRTRLAPSLFGSAVARGSADGNVAGDLFCCPVCGVGVRGYPGGYRCRSCDRLYPLRDGILDFRP